MSWLENSHPGRIPRIEGCDHGWRDAMVYVRDQEGSEPVLVIAAGFRSDTLTDAAQSIIEEAFGLDAVYVYPGRYTYDELDHGE